ncbi:MAG TPA: cytochrome c3 family protein [Planctomycetota bacterium]|nr:cytochrome c3 family protein [Planctomycetota bacterium]
MALLRDAKARAKRIDLAYFRRLHPFRRWRRILSLAAPLAAAAWIAAVAARGDERIYNGGALAARHAIFENKCAACHTTPWAMRYTDPAGWQERLDLACLGCHNGPVHHLNAPGSVRGPESHLTAARCSQCHVEHRELRRLAEVGDRDCTVCHGDLKTSGPERHPAACRVGAGHRIHTAIQSFSRGHPEFELLARKTPDPTVVSFNHAVHLHPDTPQKRGLLESQLKAQKTRPGVQAAPGGALELGCAYCHQPAAPGAYMAPILYERHCAECHPLKLKDDRVPHRSPDVVRDFLRSRLAQGGKGGDPLAELVTEAEIPIYTSDPDGCMKCHKTDLGPNFPATAPVVTPTGLRPGAPGDEGAPRRWFLHSKFDHRAHQELRCLECHGAADSSRLTADVLMPSQALCLRCHGPSGGAASTCATCHLYHDRTREGAAEGRLRIPEVLK